MDSPVIFLDGWQLAVAENFPAFMPLKNVMNHLAENHEARQKLADAIFDKITAAAYMYLHAVINLDNYEHCREVATDNWNYFIGLSVLENMGSPLGYSDVLEKWERLRGRISQVAGQQIPAKTIRPYRRQLR